MGKAALRIFERFCYVLIAVLAFFLCYIFVSWSPSLGSNVSQTIAAWVQGIGSLGAIVGTLFVLRKQSQHNEEMFLRQRLEARIEVAVGVCAVITNAFKVMKFLTKDLSNREEITEIVNGERYFDHELVANMDRALKGIPLHSVGDEELIMLIEIQLGIVLQFKKNIGRLWEHCREMDAVGFEDFFETTKGMSEAGKDVAGKARAHLSLIKAS